MFKFIFAFVVTMLLGCFPASAASPPPIDRSRTVLIQGPLAQGNVLPLGAKLMEYAVKDATKPVNIVINSPGGEVQTGYLFIDMIEDVKAQGVTVNCYVQRLAASMAFQILLHCNNRYAPRNALLLWHPAKVFMMGTLTSGQAEAISDDLLVINSRILDELTEGVSGATSSAVLKHYYRETLHFAFGLEALTHGRFLTTFTSIPGLLEINSTTVPSMSLSDRAFVLKAGQIYYVYEDGL